MKKNLKYNVKLSLCNNGEHEGTIAFASCACPAGKGPHGSCKHTAAPCYALEIDFFKKIYEREERNNVKPLNDPRRPSERNNDSKKVNRKLLDKIKRVKPNCGFVCLLSDEKLGRNKNEIISPIKEHLSHSQRFLTGQKQLREISWLVSRGTAHCTCHKKLK